jgi:phosphatidylglycerol---prolipoprotein diacylglyceryl transferase
MIVHNFDPVLVDFGFLQVRWYSIAYILGITLGWLYAIKIIKKIQKKNHNYQSLKEKNFDDFILYLILGVIIGGRLGYVIFYNFGYYLTYPYEIIKVWQGGMSFHGGLIGVITAIFIFSKIKKISFYKISDIVSCVAPIGLFFGRIANFINGELYGKVSNLPWAVIFPAAGDSARHPSQIYEAILEGIVLFYVIKFFAFKKNLIVRNGCISALFLIFYSFFRVFSEFFREADNHIGYYFNYFSTGVLLSLITLLFGFLIIFTIPKNE